jgi:peptide-methionine (S)-S-oxide reductase
MQLAYLAGGCFWCIEAIFQRINGVKSVNSGYCNGDTIGPTYTQVCSGTTGHAETLKIEFDESIISYEELLEVFFQIHDPTSLNKQGNDHGTQYRSAIFFTNKNQQSIAQDIINTLGNDVVTEVTEIDIFYEAESYHNNYFNNNSNQPYCQLVIAPKIKKYFSINTNNNE